MTNHQLDEAGARLAQRQAGAFSRRQVLAAGGNDQQIHRRVRSGRWVVRAPGVYSLQGAPPHPDRRLWLAVLTAGPNSVVSHEAAAGVGRFPGFEGEQGIALIVPHGTHPRIPGVFAHQIDDLHSREIGTVRGLPVTTPARTFVDLVVAAAPDKIRHALEGMIVDDRITTQRIGAVLGRIARPGKPRLHVIASILDELGPYREGIPESVLEKRVVQLVLDAGVGEPHLQYPLPGSLPGRCRCDVALPPPRMIIEADGRRWHARMEAMSTDRLRDQTSGREGWHTTRFTWDQLEEDYEGCVQTVRATYQVRMAQLGRRRVA